MIASITQIRVGSPDKKYQFCPLPFKSLVVTVFSSGFSLHKFYFLATEYTYVFYVYLTTKNDYLPIQPELLGSCT